jgi:anionic cell wall polymer biosynthesis LytR-Cps2A-Psr (LCP) family protein
VLTGDATTEPPKRTTKRIAIILFVAYNEGLRLKIFNIPKDALKPIAPVKKSNSKHKEKISASPTNFQTRHRASLFV